MADSKLPGGSGSFGDSNFVFNAAKRESMWTPGGMKQLYFTVSWRPDFDEDGRRFMVTLTVPGGEPVSSPWLSEDIEVLEVIQGLMEDLLPNDDFDDQAEFIRAARRSHQKSSFVP